MAQQQVLTKTLTTSSSGMLGFFSSGAVLYTSGSSAAVGTSSGSVGTLLDTGRRIIVWSSAAASDSLTITLTGLSSGGDLMSETIVGSSAAGSVRTTVQDFYQVTAITYSSSLNVRMNVGTSSRAGTPWITANIWATPFDLTAVVTTTTSSNSILTNFECTLDDITQTVPSPSRSWSSNQALTVPFYPAPFISQSAGSTFVSSTGGLIASGNITTPISAWRITLTSSSSNAGTVGVTVLQSG